MSGYGSLDPRRRAKASLALAPIALLVLLLAACGEEAAPEAAPAPTAVSTPVPLFTLPTPIPAPIQAQVAVAPALALPSLSDVVDKITPAVASISTQSIVRGLFFEIENEGAGSGVVVRSDGYVVTNYHVIGTADTIKVHLPNGKTYDAELVGRDLVTDLAVLKIDGTGLPAATLASVSDRPRVGDWVLTVGNALALKGGPSVTLGIISGMDRTIRTERGSFYGLLQTDAAINTGNSGGPLVNLDGEVIGINQAILRQAPGVGFAIAAWEAEPIIESLIELGYVVRPLIGFNGDDVTPAIANELGLRVSDGVIVTSMSRDGPAAAAGISVGDIVTKVDGIPTRDLASFLQLLWSYSVGDEVVVEYIHDNEILTATIGLDERPP